MNSSIHHSHTEPTSCQLLQATELEEINTKRPVEYGSIEGDTRQGMVVFDVWSEVWTMLGLALPMTVSSSMRAVVFNTDTIYLGRLGVVEQAGATLGENLTEMMSMLYCGFTYSLTPLVSGCHARGRPEVGAHYTQLCMTIVFGLLIPLSCCFYFFTGTFYSIIFGTDPEVCAAAELFNQLFIYGVFFLAILQVLRAFASGLGEPGAALVASASVVALNIFFNQTFIFGLPGYWAPLGYAGSPLASSVALFFQLLIFFVYAFVWQKIHIVHNAWPGLSWKAYKTKVVRTFVNLSIPNAIGGLVEVVGFRTLASLGSTMGPTTSAALACMVSIEGLWMVAAAGIGEATMVRISHHISKGDIVAAKKTLQVGFVISLGAGSGVCFLMCYYRFTIVQIYSSDLQVQATLLAAFPALQTGVICMALMFSASFGLQAMSRTLESALIKMGVAWLVLLPFATYFGFYTTGLPCSGYLGIMWAPPVAYGTNFLISQYMLFYRTDWVREVRLSRERSGPLIEEEGLVTA